jgi:hypothetical protein
MARAYFEILWSRRPEGEGVAEQFLEALPTIDFSHENRLWEIEHMKDDELSGYPELTSFLPEKWRQKQIGEKVGGKVRFGSRHNESILVLPGIIRYLAKLPPTERRTSEPADGGERPEQLEGRKIDKPTAQLMKAIGVDQETAQLIIADTKAKISGRELEDEPNPLFTRNLPNSQLAES